MYVCVCACMRVCRDVWTARTWQPREVVITKDGGTAHRQRLSLRGHFHTVNKLSRHAQNLNLNFAEGTAW